MKKAIVIILCMTLVGFIFTGCGNSNSQNSNNNSENETNATNNNQNEVNNDTSNNNNDETSNDEQNNNNDTDEIIEIIWQYPSPGNLGSGFQDMEDALNELMEKNVGTHVTFEPVPLMESQQKAILMVSAGEQLDLALTAFTSVSPLVTGELILPLNDLVEEHGQGIIEEGTDLLSAYYAGKLYGIPPIDKKGNGSSYLIRDKFVEKYDIEIDKEKIYSLEDLEEIFEVVKEGEGENFYCNIPWPGTDEPANNGYIEYDKVAGTLAAGVLMLNRSFDELTLYNIFDTEEYEYYANKMYDWAQKGYISPDAAVTSEFPDTLIATDNYLGSFYWGGPTVAEDYSATIGVDFTKLRTIEPYVVNGGGAGIQWHIPITSINPAKAMETLDYLYSHNEANWIVQYGLEGETYEVLENSDEGTQIKYLSEDKESLPYINPYGLWGNIMEHPAVYPAPSNKESIVKEFNDNIKDSRISPAKGYNFIQETVSSELAAVETVIDQYTPTINAGALDPEDTLPEFIEALEASGINTVIEENQRQLDKWAAENK